MRILCISSYIIFKPTVPITLSLQVQKLTARRFVNACAGTLSQNVVGPAAVYGSTCNEGTYCSFRGIFYLNFCLLQV